MSKINYFFRFIIYSRYFEANSDTEIIENIILLLIEIDWVVYIHLVVIIYKKKKTPLKKKIDNKWSKKNFFINISSFYIFLCVCVFFFFFFFLVVVETQPIFWGYTWNNQQTQIANFQSFIFCLTLPKKLPNLQSFGKLSQRKAVLCDTVSNP